MTIRSLFPTFDFAGMPEKSEEIAGWLDSQPTEFSFPFVGREALADGDSGRILDELLEFEHEGFRPFHAQVAAMFHLGRVLGDSAISVQEAALIWHTDWHLSPASGKRTRSGTIAEKLSTWKRYRKSSKTDARLILDLRNLIGQDQLSVLSDGNLSMDYLNILDSHVLPRFFTSKAGLYEFNSHVYPTVTRMMTLLDASGMLEFGNNGYTQSLLPDYDWLSILYGENAEDADPDTGWDWQRIILPSDITANGDLASYFGIFTTKKVRQKKSGQYDRASAMIFAGLGGILPNVTKKSDKKPSINAAHAAMLSELCCAAFLNTWDRPILSGDNCPLSADGTGRPAGHAPGGCPDSYALYDNGTILTLEPSLQDGKTTEEWETAIESAMRHARGKLCADDKDWKTRRGHDKFSFLVVPELPKNPEIMRQLLKIAANSQDQCLFPVSFGMMQALCQVFGTEPLTSTHPDAIRRFLSGMKKDMAELYGKLNRGAKSGKGKTSRLHLAQEGDMEGVMVPLMARHLRILLTSVAKAREEGKSAGKGKKGNTKGAGPAL